MSGNKILRIFATIHACFLLNVALIDGFLFNIFSVLFLNKALKINGIEPDTIQNHRVKAVLSMALVMGSIYMLTCIFSRNFLQFKRPSRHKRARHHTNSHFTSRFFTFVVPVAFLVYLAICIAVFSINHYRYNPNNSVFHKKPVIQDDTNRVEKQHTFKSIFKKAKKVGKNLLHLRLNDKPKEANHYTSVESLPWNVLDLDYLKRYHFELRYYKHLWITLFAMLIFVLVFIKYNFQRVKNQS